MKNLDDGVYERDASGRLTGVLRERAAGNLECVIPQPTAAESRAAIRRAQDYALSLGITAVTSSVRAENIQHYLDFAQSGDRKLRLNVWRVSERFELSEDLFERKLGSGFRLATLKGFTDGALGSRTGAFWQPYADSEQRGHARSARRAAGALGAGRAAGRLPACAACHRRPRQQHLSRRPRNGGLCRTRSRIPSAHRARAASARAGLSPLRRTRCHRLDAADSLHLGHAFRRTASGTGAGQTGLCVAQPAESWRDACLRQRLAGG